MTKWTYVVRQAGLMCYSDRSAKEVLGWVERHCDDGIFVLCRRPYCKANDREDVLSLEQLRTEAGFEK